MDRLIGIVALRLRTDLRGLLWARERLFGLALLVPALGLLSLLASGFVLGVIRSIAQSEPGALLPVLSAAGTALGTFWALSPLLTGAALSDTHDVSRLVHFPVHPAVIAASSLLVSLLRPATLASLPVCVSVALALTPRPARLPFVLACVFLSFALVVAAAHVTGLVLHRLSRGRRLHDLLLFLGLAAGLLLSLLPIVLLTSGPGPLGHVLRALARGDLFAFSPYAWGLRAAIYAGRGQVGPALVLACASALCLFGTVLLSGFLVHLIYRGDLDLGTGSVRGRPARMPLGGALGALVEKDLRVAWRDPALRALLVTGLVGPLVMLFVLARGRFGLPSGAPVLLLASFVGLSSFGANAFGFERRGISLLLSFPVSRWRILVAKNLAGLVFRIPGLVTLLLAAALFTPLAEIPAALTIVAITLLLCSGVDNYHSILFPVAVPPPGSNPYGRAARGRAPGATLVGLLLLAGALMLTAPFAFLAWLPLLLRRPMFWAISLPLAAAGAVSLYAMLVAGAGRLLERREPELQERILGEA